MATTFFRITGREKLHDRVTRMLGMRVIEADRTAERIAFPNEADLSQQLGVSRTIVREAVKVLANKGLVEVRPRSGTRPRPRAEWHLLDPDILSWQAQVRPDARLLRDLCEVRLAIEPTAAGFAAIRASADELAGIERCLTRRETANLATDPDEAIDMDLEFHTAVIGASHNPMLQQLSATIRQPMRAALSYTVRLPAPETLAMEGQRALFEALRRRDPMDARAASEKIVGLAMLAVEQVIQSQEALP
jgi:GntR family transcriptional regulator, galactonate operon transcriptional repressor